MKDRPLIMVTNDDGIDSPGLHATVQAILPLGEVLIAAPKNQQSATGGSLLATPGAVFESREILVEGQTLTGWFLDASPAKTVAHALQCLTPHKQPDLLVSGINYGENLGLNVNNSGTIGAALQGAAWGIKGVAASLEVEPEFHYHHGRVDWSNAILILRRMVQKALDLRWPEDVHVLKLEIPQGGNEQTPWRMTKQSLEPGWYAHMPSASPQSPAGTAEGRRGPREGKELPPQDDLYVIRERQEVSVTPLSMDMTSRTDRKALSLLLELPSDAALEG